jgi:hypothetical protein
LSSAGVDSRSALRGLETPGFMRFLILHYHIFKNAGTTLENLLQKNFPQTFARFEGDGRDAQLSAAELLAFVREHPELQAISSHHLRYPRPCAPGFVFFDLLFLRDPIDRLGSIYTFFQQDAPTGDPLSRLAHESDLRGFFVELLEKHPHIANNPQVNMLAGDGAYTRPPGPADLARATQTMLDAALLGVVDCFLESLVAGQYFWHPAFPNLDIAAAPANVASARGSTLAGRRAEVERACGPRLYRELAGLNELDLELVRRARAEVARRFHLVPRHAKRLQALMEEVRRLGGGDLTGDSGLPRSGSTSAFWRALTQTAFHRPR